MDLSLDVAADTGKDKVGKAYFWVFRSDFNHSAMIT